jgi:replicative DNA helicase
MTLERLKVASSFLSAEDVEEWQPAITATSAEPTVTVDVRRVLEALAHLAPSRADNYDQWFKVGCALRSLGDEYFSLFDLWSKQSGNYGATREKWDSMQQDGRISIGSLFYWAREDAKTNDSHAQESSPFKVYSSKEFFEGDFRIRYLIDDCFVAGQPMLVGGMSKTLKTSICVDAATSLASGAKFLTRFPVSAESKVLIMSGESGLGTLQETGFRICKSKGVDPFGLDNLKWSSDIPRCDSEGDLDRLRDAISNNNAEVLFIDPAYLALGGDDHGNVFKQGQLLRKINSICIELGCTLVLVHHNRKGIKPGPPPKLEDMAMAGFAEFARQWWLLNRITEYRDRQPHELWLRVGGSAGHSGLFELTVSEGSKDDEGGRKWELQIVDHQAEKQRMAESDVRAVRELLEKHRAGLTVNAIQKATQFSRIRVKRALGAAEFMQALVPPGGKKKTPVAGYALVREATTSQDNTAA